MGVYGGKDLLDGDLNRHWGGYGHPLLNNLERGTLFATHAPGFSTAADAAIQTVCIRGSCARARARVLKGGCVWWILSLKQTNSEQIYGALNH